MTNELIDRLAGDLRPVPRAAVGRRLAIGVGCGAVISAALMLAFAGPRPDFPAAWAMPSFWIKFAYTLLLAVAGLWAAERLARPAGEARGPGLAATAGVGFVVVLAVAQFLLTPPEAQPQIVFGQTANICPWKIIALALPVFGGAVWAMRGMAPTRLPLAGLAAGLLAGGFGAWIYSFHCPETGMPFLALWYSAGIVGTAVLGAASGRWLLRW